MCNARLCTSKVYQQILNLTCLRMRGGGVMGMMEKISVHPKLGKNPLQRPRTLPITPETLLRC